MFKLKGEKIAGARGGRRTWATGQVEVAPTYGIQQFLAKAGDKRAGSVVRFSVEGSQHYGTARWQIIRLCVLLLVCLHQVSS
jgi:hypothetical protein